MKMNNCNSVNQFEALKKVLNELDKAAIHPRDKGEKFEYLCKQILENAPIFKTKVKKVWMYKDFPGKIGTDDGIDLVVLTKDDSFVAVQCKFYDWDHTVAKSDIDKLISAATRDISKSSLSLSLWERIKYYN